MAAQKLAEKKQIETTRVVEPEERVSTIMMIAGLSGILGSKIAHNLEHVDKLIADPIGQLLLYGIVILRRAHSGYCMRLWYARQKHVEHFIARRDKPRINFGYGLLHRLTLRDGDHQKLPKPDSLGFLPDWAWSFTYPNNVLSAGDPIPLRRQILLRAFGSGLSNANLRNCNVW